MAYLQAELNELDQALAALTLDTPVLARADEITRLDEARVQCHDHPARLQRHQEKLQTLQARVKALAAELGWPAEDEAAMARRLPDPAWRERTAQLICKHQTLRHAVEKARNERDAQAQNLSQWQAHLQSLASDSIDPALSDLLEQARRLGDPDAQSDAQASERQRLDAALEATLAGMGPWRQPIDRLQAMLVPETSQVDALRVQQHDDARALQARQEALQKKIQDIQQQEQALLQLVRHHQPVSREDVAQARQQRDDDWQAIKADPATLPARAGAFEARMHEADTLADARLERAKHEADRQSCTNQLEKLKLDRTGIESDIQAIETRMAQRLADWQAQAAACGLPDLPLDAAPIWLKRVAGQAPDCRTPASGAAPAGGSPAPGPDGPAGAACHDRPGRCPAPGPRTAGDGTANCRPAQHPGSPDPGRTAATGPTADDTDPGGKPMAGVAAGLAGGVG